MANRTVTPVVCVGALHLDAKARVIGPLLPGTSNPADVVRSPGGVAANIARCLTRLEVPVALVSIVGNDDIGHRLLARLASEGVDVDGVVVTSAAVTATYTAVLGRSGELAFGIADMGIYERLDGSLLAPALRRHRAGMWCVDANTAPSGLAAIAAATDRLILDPVSVAKAPRLLPVLSRTAAVFPDHAEAEALTGMADPAEAAQHLVAAGAALAVVSRGADGVVVSDGTHTVARAALPVKAVVDVTGAGDAMVAGYIAALAHGASDPVGWGLAAASLAVETAETVPEALSVEAVRGRVQS